MPQARAVIFIGLNVIRTLSIIGLVLVFASNVVIMAHDVQAVNRFISEVKHTDNSTLVEHMLNCDYIEGSTVPNQPAGAFWAVVNRLFIICQVIVLVLSELGWPAAFFNRFFPVLGNEFGLGAMGVFQCLIGAAVLSHFVDDFALVSAFFLFALGCLNIVVGLIWRESAKSKRSITTWRDMDKPVLPVHVTGFSTHSSVSSLGEKNGDVSDDSLFMNSTGKPGMGFGRQGEKAAATRGFTITPPMESLPRYIPRPGSSGAPLST